MSRDLSTVLICPVCNGTLFKEKDHEGTILLHCANCGGSAKVSTAGIGFAVVEHMHQSGRVFPVVREKSESKRKRGKQEFEIMEFRLPPAVKKLVQAALWAAKCATNSRGAWYAGAMLAHICSDFLSGFDFSSLSPPDLERVTRYLQESAQELEEQKAHGEVFPAFSEGFRESAGAAISAMAEGPLTVLPELLETKTAEFQQQKQEGYKTRMQRAVQAKKQASFNRLEACVRALDFQLSEATASASPDDVLDREYLAAALERGAQYLAEVKSGEKPMSHPNIQYFMKKTEERLGLPHPRKNRRAGNV